MRVRLSAWTAGWPRLRCREGFSLSRPWRKEAAVWPAKLSASTCLPTRSSTSAASPTPRRRPKLSPSAPASSSAATPPACAACHATITSPPNWAAPPTPSPSGAAASSATASPACATCRAAAARPLFPPEDKHKVLVLATTPPADVGVPTSHWSLDDLAYHILKDNHYEDMSRSTIQRVLAAADLQPHRSRYWLKSHDPDFEAKTLDVCGLYLRSLALHAQGELVISVDEKTSIQALERKHATLPMRPGQIERREHEYIR